MKLSAKSRYALRLLIDIALHSGAARPRTIRQMSESQQISEKFISRLVVPMRNAGMISSVRGVQGGFLLGREPSGITLLDIVETLEGPVSISDCVMDRASCGRSGACIARSAWSFVNGSLRDSLRSVTLADVLKGDFGTESKPTVAKNAEL